MNKISKLIYFIILLLIMAISPLSVNAARVHRVNPGENLYKIAQNYQVTMNEIIQLNNLKNPGNIFTDQVLIIPETEASYFYRVKKGDTLFKIAQKLDTTVKRLVETNYISPEKPLYVRQVLYIPPKLNKYEVKKGDTLQKIADKYEIELKNLIAENNLRESNEIYPGDILIIPEVKNDSIKYEGPNYKKLFPDTFFRKGKTNEYKITLTFDDGPDKKYTPEILDLLKKYNIKATFFVLGKRVKKYPEIVKRMINEGHIVANHSWSHADLSKSNDQLINKEINDTEKLLKKIINKEITYLRPPYGAVSERLLNISKAKGYKVINWTVDSRDWSAMDVDQILINTLPNVKKDSILLFHSAGGENHDLSATAKVLPEIINTLKILDYEFVNLNNLL